MIAVLVVFLPGMYVRRWGGWPGTGWSAVVALGRRLAGVAFPGTRNTRVSSQTGSGLDLFARLVLRRVQAGEIHATGRGYVGLAGRPVHRDLARELRQLREAGYVCCDAAETHGHHPVTLTVVGLVVLGQWQEGEW